MRISDWSSDVCSSDLLQSEQQIGPLQSVVQLAGMIFRPPHWRANASVEWQRSDITLAGVFTYIGGSTDDRIQPTVNVESRSEEHTSELQSLKRKSYDVCCLTKTIKKHKKKNKNT